MNKFVNDPQEAGGQGVAISRRGFLIGATSAGFTLAFSCSGLGLLDPAEAIASQNFEPTLWYRIDHDGLVTVNIAKAEMGQHVGTALARIVADELEADWQSVRLNYVDTHPKWGLMVTGGSWSVWQSFEPLSQAGAAGRIALIEEGARLLGVAPAACTARNSRVQAGKRSISYAEIVQRGDLTRSLTADELKRVPLKKPTERRLIGKETLAIVSPRRPTAAPAMASMRASRAWSMPARCCRPHATAPRWCPSTIPPLKA